MQLTVGQYRNIKIATVVVLAMAFSQSFVFKNFFIPIVLLVAGSLLLMYFRRRVNGVLADERDYATGGKAALLAIQIYSWIAVLGMLALYSASDLNPYYQPVAMALAFSTTLLLLIYAVMFRYYDKFKFSDRKFLFTVIVAVIFLVAAIATIRTISGEDDWICKNGQWVKHGNPSFAPPQTECK